MAQRPQIPDDMKAFNQKVIDDFRTTGKFTGPMAGRQMMLLTTKGATTGQDRTVVIGYRPAGSAMVVIASANGAEEHPAWYRNLLSNPHATVEVEGQTRFEVRARTAEGEERERLGALVDYLPGQQEKTKRQIPVVVLEPVR